MTVFLSHNRVKLALHTLRTGEGRALLHLHALGEHSPTEVPDELAAWPGPIFALDFTGHGASTVPGGGGYTAEVLMGDADAALNRIGEATVIGRGLGAYIALMLSGARPDRVHGAILCDGAGLVGGGERPGGLAVRGVPGKTTTPDPFALVELSTDLRPTEYVTRFVELAAEHSPLADPISVTARARPDWLRAVSEMRGVRTESIEEALNRFA
jgi:pimeloyl-ACP methyl ester carboxylesterase